MNFRLFLVVQHAHGYFKTRLSYIRRANMHFEQRSRNSCQLHHLIIYDLFSIQLKNSLFDELKLKSVIKVAGEQS